MKSDETLALLTLENPVQEDDLPGTKGQAALALIERILLEGGSRPVLSSPVKRGRRRLARRVLLAATAAAAIAAGLLVTTPGDGPSTASAVKRAAAALDPREDTILHVVTRATLRGPDGRPLSRERSEAWHLNAPPHSSREVHYSQGELRNDVATTDDGVTIYDPRTNTISLLPRMRRPVPIAPIDTGKRVRDVMLRMLKSGEAREDGRVTIDGRQAIRIVASRDDTTLIVDAQSYEPIEWTGPVSGIGTTPDRGALTTRFELYERLPASEANLALLDLRAQHPDAKLDKRITIDPDSP